MLLCIHIVDLQPQFRSIPIPTLNYSKKDNTINSARHLFHIPGVWDNREEHWKTGIWLPPIHYIMMPHWINTSCDNLLYFMLQWPLVSFFMSSLRNVQLFMRVFIIPWKDIQIDRATGEGGEARVILVAGVRFKQNELSARLNESCEFH